jgi:putative ABC transport system substrate-binding protein
MSYSSDTFDLARQSVTYVDRILRGAKVNDLPVQYPTKFWLIANFQPRSAGVSLVPSTASRVRNGRDIRAPQMPTQR